MTKNHYEVIIVGGGITGTSLFYELSEFTNIKKIALLEKYEGIAKLNSHAKGNSQTLHMGDIETNYTLQKAEITKQTSSMVSKYIFKYGYKDQYLKKCTKMAFGVGEEEVEQLKNRHDEFSKLFPYLEIATKDELLKIEPNIILDINGNSRNEEVIGLVAKDHYCLVDFGAVAESFVQNALKKEDKQTDIFLNCQVENIQKIGDIYHVYTKNGENFTADFVVVDAGAHSLFLAHKMYYGLEYSILPIAGSFYIANKKILNSKVYMMQHPKMPFAALHGDPDLIGGVTRFGPTALGIPKLERFRGCSSVPDMFKSLKLDKNVLKIITNLLSDSDIRNYILRNYAFEMPIFGKEAFLKDARKLVPSLKSEDISFAKGFGGVRPQVLDKKNKELLLGEANINTGCGIIFNMTPSPGATSCLANSHKDAKTICNYLGKELDESRFDEYFIGDLS